MSEDSTWKDAYNIRYHIIKKRIDKVLILETNERLTQPEKSPLFILTNGTRRNLKG